MKQYFYIDAQGNQVGPIGLDELRRAGISAYTLVWTEGMPTWAAASTLAELAGYLPPVPPTLQGHDFGLSSGTKEPENTTMKPDNYLVWAILSTLFCCMPFGIVAIVKANKVNSLWQSGQHKEAVQASTEAKNWCLISVGGSLFICAIYTLMMLISIAAS